MSHLSETGLTYFQHLRRAWSVAFICVVHGLIPAIWEHKASDIINSDPLEFKTK